MGPDDFDRLLATAFWPLVFGGLAAFLFLGLLAYTHLRTRALLDLCRQAVKLREAQEEIKKRIGSAPMLPRTQKFERALRDLLAREGLKPPPPPPPAQAKSGTAPARS